MVLLGHFYFKYIFCGVAFLALIPLLICVGNIRKFQTIETVPQRHLRIGKAAKTRSLLVTDLLDKEIPSDINESEIDASTIRNGTPIKQLYEPGFDEIGKQICPDLGASTELLVIITSAPSNKAQRDAIRKTWGGYAKSQNISVGFILGRTQDKNIDKAIVAEQKLYHDIIKGKFLDSYDNLTLKSISLMEWVDSYCPKTAFVLKTDDDVFINVYKLVEVINGLDPDEKAIYGRLAKNWKPVRNKTSKYYVPFEQYDSETFPVFTTGPAYIFPAFVAKDLYTAALLFNYFKLEDVFLTGVVASSLNINRVHGLPIVNRHVSLIFCNLSKHVSIHPVPGEKLKKYWMLLQTQKKFFCRPGLS